MIGNHIQGYVPSASIEQLDMLWDQYPFKLKITRDRVSKLGDYRYDPKEKDHLITVNGSLNEYSFLITLVHEIAHQHVRIHFKRVHPHGSEWKKMFRDLMLPFLRPEIFPEDVLRRLAYHMRNPKASSSADHELTEILSSYDEEPSSEPTLRTIVPGEVFEFRGKDYLLLKHRRTRSLCEEQRSRKRYLIPMVCRVRPKI